MGAPSEPGRSRSRGILVLVVLGWLGVMVALAGLLATSQADARRQVAQRLAARASGGAEFASLYTKDILARERQQATVWLSRRETMPQDLGRAASALGVSAAVLLDRRGRVLQSVPNQPALIGQDITGTYPHLATAIGGTPAVSNVVPSAARGLPVVGFAEPFATAFGRRVFSGGYEVAKTPLGAYMSHVIVVTGRRVYLVDATGTLIASSQPQLGGGKTLGQLNPRLAMLARTQTAGSYDSAWGHQYFVNEPVTGTPWRIVASVPEAQLYVSIDGASKSLAWVAVASLGIAGLLIILMGSRLLRSRARLTKLNRELDRVARVDSLTGLRNRRDIEETLVAALSGARRREASLAVLLIDIDHFKHVNDTLGHQVGDAVLVRTGNRIRASVRAEDAVGRWGGEEFLAVLPDADARGAVVIAERLRAHVAEPEPEPGNAHPGTTVTVSIGAAVWTSGGIDDLITRADRALYAAKAAGRNNVQLSCTEPELASIG
jgi:diguanylate cyclase (GGDEF)-like protein